MGKKKSRLDVIVDEMVAAGYAQPFTETRFPLTGTGGDGAWEGLSLHGADAVHNALAAPDCPEGAKVFLRRIIGAPEDPTVPYWKGETLAMYLRRYPAHPEYVPHARR